MIKVTCVVRQLHYVALVNARSVHLDAKGADAAVFAGEARISRDEIVEKFNAAPSGGAPVFVYVIPAEIGGEVHLAASCEKALGDEVGAVAAPSCEVSEERIS